MRHLRPDQTIGRLDQVDLKDLQKRGVTALVLDVDDTLTWHGGNRLDPDITAFLAQVKQDKTIEALFIASNSRRDLTALGEELGATVIAASRFSRKPRRSHFRKISAAVGRPPQQIAIIGDRLHTDILGGNMAGFTTVLVAPLGPSWWRRRLSLDNPNGLRLTLTLGVLAALLLALGGIIEGIRERETVAAFDHVVATTVYGWRRPGLTTVMEILTGLASIKGWLVLGGLTLAALWATPYRRFGLVLVAAIASQGAVALVLKVLFGRSRPDISLRLVAENSPSFPSGHTLAAVVGFGLITYACARSVRARWQRLVWLAAGTGLILAVGLSRVYLGVHFPSDVLASLCLGGAALVLVAGWVHLREQIFGPVHFDAALRRRLLWVFGITATIVVIARPWFI